jgi:plastocyanin
MGAGGHSVIISSDIREFLHVHPTQEVDRNWKGGPDISFRTNFPKPGLYKAWGQFQHQGRIVVADFNLKVA